MPSLESLDLESPEAEVSSCALGHYSGANEWEKREPVVTWFSKRSVFGRYFVKARLERSDHYEIQQLQGTSAAIQAVIAASASARTAVADQPIEKLFREHADKWERETAFLSATPMRVLHDSYQSIMAMGPKVVPILLSDLQKTQRHWFWALRHLTNIDPVPEKDKGNVDKMIAAWVEWGKREGKI